MSTYDKRKFYWLQLKEDFFDDDAIQWLEEQKPNGKEYAYFYLKLCLKSLKTNGVLIRKVGNMLIPYDEKKLAELTNTDFDTVVIAMRLLKEIGLIKILENGEIYIEHLEELIGSKSLGAFQKERQRLVGGQMSADCLPNVSQMSANCPPDIELELDIELDKEIDCKEEIEPDSENDKKIEIIKQVIDYLNQKTGKNYKYTTNSTKRKINARLNEGYNLDDFIAVIDNKARKWLGTELEQYLRPETLFGTKFESYLNEKTKVQNKQSSEEKVENVGEIREFDGVVYQKDAKGKWVYMGVAEDEK